MKRFIVGTVPGQEIESPGVNVAMCLEGEENAVLERIVRLTKTSPAICWQITTDSPFGRAR